MEQVKMNARIASAAAYAILIASSAVVFLVAVTKPSHRYCAIEYTTTDGNRYRPSVADTCEEALQGFNWQSLPADWREVVTVRFSE